MKISRAALAVGALLALAASVAPAYADTFTTYNWTTSGVGTSGEIPAGAGTITVDTSLTTTVDGFVADKITAITGSIGSGSGALSISGLSGVDTNPFSSNDNLLFTSGSPASSLDGAGLAFTVTGASGVFSLWGNAPNTQPGELGPNPYVLYSSSTGELSGTFNLAPVPLPSSVWMLILGLGGLGFAALHKSKRSNDESAGFFAA